MVSRMTVAWLGLLTVMTTAAAGPADLFTEREIDFGVTPKGSVQVHYFRFTNTTNQTLKLGNPRVSCGCTSATLTSHTVAPGETAAVIAYMDTRRIPQANVSKSVLIYVPFLSPTYEEVTLRVRTIARDDLLMSPDRLSFGTVQSGAGATVTTRVTFLGDPDWKVTEARSAGVYIDAQVREEDRRVSGVTYSVTATLSPSCPIGNWTSEVRLRTSNPLVAELRIPVSVKVVPAVEVSPEQASFGVVRIGERSERTITLKATVPFKILEVRGADEEVQVLVDRTATSDRHTVVAAVSPRRVGGLTRAVEIVTDHKNAPSVIIPVVARAVDQK